MLITAIIVTYNSAKVIEAALRCVYEHPKVAECIVVDNASNDETVRIVREHFPKVKILQNSVNAGFGVACNHALDQVATEMALLLNPDATIDSAGIDALAAGLSLNPDAAIIAPEIGSHGDKPLPAGEAVSVTFVSGAVALWRMPYMREVGFFDPAFFLFFEDDDISIRTLKTGYKLLLLPGVNVKHVPGRSCVLTDEVESTKLRSSVWSSLYFTGKYRGKIRAKLRALHMIMRMFWASKYYGWQKVDEPTMQLSVALAELDRNWRQEEKKLREHAEATSAIHRQRLEATIKLRDDRARLVEKTLNEAWSGFIQEHEQKQDAAQKEFEERWLGVMARNENLQAGKAEHERLWAVTSHKLNNAWADMAKQHENARAVMMGECEAEWFEAEKKLTASWHEQAGRHQEQFTRLVRQYEAQRIALLKELEIHYPALKKKQESNDRLWAALYYLRNPQKFVAYAG